MSNKSEVYEQRKQQMDLISQKLENGVREVFTSENYTRYLETFSKFHNYSVNNTILILMQYPAATHVASFRDWNKKFNRVVKKGEKGIQILVPTPKKYLVDKEVSNPDGSISVKQEEYEKLFFKPGYVFDVSQTVGDPLPSLEKEIDFDIPATNKLINLIFSTSEIPIQYDFSLTANDEDGYYRADVKEIYLKSTLPPLDKLKTIIYLLNRYYQEEKYECHFKNYDYNTREVVAKSTAFCVLEMLANQFNIPKLKSNYSFEDIAMLGSKDQKELKSTLILISKLSIHIFSWFSDLFKSL